MATPTYDLLQSVTLATAASSVTFSSINGSYGDLILVATPLAPASNYFNLALRFNSDSGNNYAFVVMSGNGTTNSSGYGSSEDRIRLSRLDLVYSSDVINQTTCQIFDYSANDKYKSTLTRCNTALNYVEALAGIWKNTSAITSIEVFVRSGSGEYAIGSTFNLYGLRK